MMRVAIGSDHAAHEMKQRLIDRQAEYEVTDVGTHSTGVVDYPDSAVAVGTAILDNGGARGIVVRGTGTASWRPATGARFSSRTSHRFERPENG